MDVQGFCQKLKQCEMIQYNLMLHGVNGLLLKVCVDSSACSRTALVESTDLN